MKLSGDWFDLSPVGQADALDGASVQSVPADIFARGRALVVWTLAMREDGALALNPWRLPRMAHCARIQDAVNRLTLPYEHFLVSPGALEDRRASSVTATASSKTFYPVRLCCRLRSGD